jgi:hypothetical protein
MVTIRNGYDAKPSSSSSSLIRHLPQLISIFFLMAISFYGGMLVGMHLQVLPDASNAEVTTNAGNNADFDKRVEEEVQRRMETMKSEGGVAADEKKSVKIERGSKNARFPSTVEKFAAGIGLMSKNDFLANFDYGIPKVSLVI